MTAISQNDFDLATIHFSQDSYNQNSLSNRLFIDKVTGEIEWHMPEGGAEFCLSEDELSEREENAERYVEIAPRGHGEHHEILQQFLESDWTDDEALKDRASATYGCPKKSIGGWLNNADTPSEARAAFESYKYDYLEQELTNFLAEHGITVAKEAQA
mgnify:CR=1 FL=1